MRIGHDYILIYGGFIIMGIGVCRYREGGVMINILLIGTLFIMGLCLAMNEGSWFPWINVIGVAMLGIVGILASYGETGQ